MQLPSYVVEKSDFIYPSFFEFLSYMFNGGNILVGPFNEFKDFQDMMRKRGVCNLQDPYIILLIYY